MHAKDMAIGGLFTGFGIIILYLTLLIPTNTLTLLTLSSFMICMTLLLTRFRTACIAYITTSLLSFLFLPINLSILYILFFGCYGLVKAKLERIARYWVELLLKFIYFNSVLLISFNILEGIMGISMLIPLQELSAQLFPQFEYAYILIAWIIAQVGFGLFDYALSLLIDLYYDFKHKKNKRL